MLRQLPEDAEPPVVLKVEVGAAAVIWLALQGDRTTQQLNQYARQVVKKRLETIDGVGQVIIGGERRRNIRVNLDLDRMAALGVTAQDVRDAFRTEHVQLPGGFLVSGTGERLHQARPRVPQPGGARRADRPLRGRCAGAPARRRRHRGRPRRRPAIMPLQRRADRGHRHRQGQQRQHRASWWTTSAAARRGDPPAAAGRARRSRSSHRRFRADPQDRRGARGAPARGHAARRPGGVVLPAQLPLDADHLHRHPGLAARRDRGDVLPRLHLQPDDAARPAAADRRGGGRRDRGARERVPAPRGGPGARPPHRRDRGHRAGRLRGGGGEPHAGVDLRPVLFIEGIVGAVLPVVRGGGHGGRAGVAVRLADAHADAVLALPRALAEARARVPLLRPAARRARRVLPSRARLGARAPRAGAAGHARRRAVERLFLQRTSARTSSPRRTTGASTSASVRRSAPAGPGWTTCSPRSTRPSGATPR